MNRTIWGALGVLIVIVLGAYFLSQNNKMGTPTAPSTTETPTATTSTESAKPQATEEMMITYSDSGFSPASLTIKVGDTVTFKNGSSKSMWVASAPHPTHTAYPEFDDKKGVDMGETYMFTFTKAGTWKYHNHLNPTDSGTFIVQ